MGSPPTEAVAVVTAGSGGIGFGIAQALIASGFRVVLTGRDAAKGDAAARSLDPSGRARFLVADALSQAEVETAVDTVVADHGRLDVLVNNAGGSGGFAPVAELSDEAWEQAFTWNVSSAFWATRRALPTMVSAGWGRIINISSVQGKQANIVNSAHYITAKHAVNGFTKAVAKEYGRSGITCNAICVGPVETELMQTAGARAAAARGITYAEHVSRYADATMTGQINRTEEVGAMAALLASENGAGITGALLNVDGGISPF
ncbi:SDR family oxidoreductase [Gordonia McavH-238-E]|uniref:SDR family NAD(P)-dependent oxidoreductase n=1 Tax=Gordonia sp. McavH-238-E TaxID=2917736 RepID=UPI001EF57A50|nr:SDR family NAD(P)-dependent oxidoreductase [Gordonia sp. McavH-238-E]MCG7633270.1 SDR family oxidoreductase [Gordonia sp. McavH-238-E]